MPDNTISTVSAQHRLVEDLRIVVADAEDLLKATAGQTGEKMAEIRVLLQDNLSRARAKLEAAEDAVKLKTREVARATDHYVHENPWKSIGMAAGFGLLVGLLIGRR